MSKFRATSLTVLGLALFFSAVHVDASAWCNTRNHCKWWSKRYTANAHVGCIGFSLPLCYQHSGGCGSASANCGWKSCLIGGASASASNGSGGCSVSTSRTGLGIAGTAATAPCGDTEQGGSFAVTNTQFDDASQTVALSFSDGELGAIRGGKAARVQVFIFRDETPEGVENDEPERTPENTVWQGSISLTDGVVSANGFDARGLTTGTDENGYSTVTLAGVRALVPLVLSAADWDSLIVQVVADESDRAE